MKRSEMIKQICDIIHLYRRATNGVTSMEIAEMTLEHIEKAGMLPPSTLAEWSPDPLRVSEWEPERESR